MQIDDLGLQIGSPLQIQMLDDESKRYTVHLIGYLPAQSLILSASTTSGNDLAMALKEDQPLIVRFKTPKAAGAFRTQIIDKRLRPYPHFHLAVPKEVESVAVQQNQLVALKQPITFLNDDEGSHPKSVTLTAISVEEGVITAQERLADEGQSATVTMSFNFAGVDNVMVLDGQITKVKTTPEEPEHILTMRFEDLDESDRILLHAYSYKQILVNMKVIEGN